MILDSERQREILLEMLAKTQFLGAAIEELYQLKKSIENASISSKEQLREV